MGAVVRTKLKNLVSGATVEDTFRMTETFQQAMVETGDAIFSYDDGSGNLVFMDAVDFEELTVPKDGVTVQIVKWGEVIVDVVLPSSETYEVEYTEPGLKKAASTGQSKDATLEGGAVIKVPI